jgi:predicted permease
MALAAALCACIGALLPAVAAGRGNVSDVLRRTSTPLPRERLLRRLFVAGEVTLAFVLLVSVVLFGQSLAQMLRANPGFDARGMLTMQVSLPLAVYSTPERVGAFYSSLQRGLEDRFGERMVSIVDELPLTGDRGRRLVRASATDPGREAVLRTASPGYFDVMRIPLVRGRTFDDGDTRLALPRVVISASLAEQLFSFADPIGQRVHLAGAPQPAEIIGVVGDVRHRAVDEPTLPTLYVSALQEPSNSSIVVVRSNGPDADVAAAVRQAVAQLDSNVPVYGIRPMSEVVSGSPGLPARRVLTATFTGFAILAVVLAAIGLFGVVAHDVASRKVELALRVALGADRMRIMRATFGQGATIVVPALALGGLLSVWAARMLMGVGFAVNRLDALSIAAPAALLIVTALTAMFPAARRAARTDPLLALRAE